MDAGASDLDYRCLHAQRRPSADGHLSMQVQFLSFLQFMLSILLSLDVIILYVVSIDHDFETSRANLDWCSKDDPLGDTFQQVHLGEDSSTEEDIGCFFETGLT